MITAYNLIDIVMRSRKRPSATSISVFIVWPIFGDFARKDLSILVVINNYNHYMGGIDTVNRL